MKHLFEQMKFDNENENENTIICYSEMACGPRSRDMRELYYEYGKVSSLSFLWW